MKEIIPLLFAFISSAAFAQQPMTHLVTVNPDGSFSPRRIQIHDGDTVALSVRTPTNSSSTALTRRNAASALRRSMAWL